MEISTLPLSALPHTSRLFQNYVSGAAGLFPYSYHQENSFEEAAGRIQYSDERRRQVVALLREQNQCWGQSAARERNMGRLSKANCLAVVTGQQVGLFTGPAFAVYKALTAVKLADYLTNQGIEAVPIFWLATEDHDLAEVNHTWVHDQDGQPRKIVYAPHPGVEDAPAGSLTLADEVIAGIAEFEQSLPPGAESRAIVDWLRSAYKPGATLGSAFGAAMAQLLSKYGVLTIDPLDTRVHRITSQVFQHASAENSLLRESLLARNEQLISSGYHAQVRVTDTSTLLFVYESGRRSILRQEGADFVSSSGTKYNASDLRGVAESRPELLSPTALLRPVLQDALLPTVAYVGGPAEIAYLAQSVPLYERVVGRMPVVVPRASITLMEPAMQRLVKKYSLGLDDVFAGRRPLREKMASRFFSEDLTAQFASATESLERHIASIQQALQQLDPTLVDAAKNAAQKMLHQISNLERKAAASVQGKSDQVERDAARLENALYPEKAMQERVYCGPSLLARFGGLQFVEVLYQAIPPLPCEHQIISL